ncbi:MAG: glycoside hydrolase family 2 TIM barrel-domain containing protein [Lachnospiraceae bacterium]
MSGIFRDVYLLTRPEEGICDYFLKALPSSDYKNGTIQIAFTYRHASLPVKAVLKDADGTVLATKTATDTLTFDISDAHLWNAEDPYLYPAHPSPAQSASQSMREQVGIREIHATDGVLYINGTKVKFHGTNRHDSDPVTGFTISIPQLMKDLTLMKEHNMNAIRTSHYPNPPHFCPAL